MVFTFSSTFHPDGCYSCICPWVFLFLCLHLQKELGGRGFGLMTVLTAPSLPSPAGSGVCWLRKGGSRAGEVVTEHQPFLQMTEIQFSVAKGQLSTSIAPVPGNLMPFWASEGTRHLHTCKQNTRSNIIKITLSIEEEKHMLCRQPILLVFSFGT